MQAFLCTWVSTSFLLSYMRILSLFFLSFLFSHVFSQPFEEDSVGVIYIGKKKEIKEKAPELPSPPLPEKVCIQYPIENQEAVSMRELAIYRLDLNLYSNIWLKQVLYASSLFEAEASSQSPTKRGLVPAILKGIQTEKIIALSPKNTEYRYTYTDYIQDLERYETPAISPAETDTDSSQNNPFNEFGIKQEETKTVTQNLAFYSQHVNQVLDFVIEKGINKHDSRGYFRIRFVQLLWYNPAISPQPKIMAIIPYHLLEPYLSQIKVHDVEHASGEFSVKQYLEMGNFSGEVIEIR